MFARLIPWPILAVCLALALTAKTSAQTPSASERNPKGRVGHSLPPGAVARLGSARLPQEVAVTGLAFSPDGKWLASGGRDGAVRLWAAATLRKVHHLKGLHGFEARVAFSPDGKLLAGAGIGGDPGVILWDVVSGKERWRGPGACAALAFSPDGKGLACGLLAGAVSLREVGTGKETRRFEGHNEVAAHLAFLDHGRTLAAVTYRHTLFLWDVTTGKERGRLANSEATVMPLGFSPDGKTLVSQPSGTEVLLWDVAAGKPGRRLRSKANADRNADYGTILGCSGAFSPDGRWLAVGAPRDHIHLWDLSSGKDFFWVCDTPRGRRISALAFSADGRTWPRAVGTASFSFGTSGTRGQDPSSRIGSRRMDRGRVWTSWCSRPTGSDWSRATRFSACACSGTWIPAARLRTCRKGSFLQTAAGWPSKPWRGRSSTS